MSVHDAIAELASDLAVIVTRRAENPRVAGREALTTDATFTIVASIQSPTGKDLDRAREGRNVTDLRVIFSQIELKAGGPGTGFKSDLVTIHGAQYEIDHLEHWHGFADDPGEHWRAVCGRFYAV